MIVSDVIRKAGRRFGDSSNVMISNQDWYDFINDAVFRIVREVGALEATSTAAANTFPLNFPADFVRVIDVKYGTDPLAMIQAEDLEAKQVDISDNPDAPYFYYLENFKIKLYPVPPVGDTTTVTTNYVKMPTNVVSTGDSIGIPTMYHEDIVTWCVARCHERNENWSAMDRFEKEFFDSTGARMEDAKVGDDSYQIIRDDYFDSGY